MFGSGTRRLFQRDPYSSPPIYDPREATDLLAFAPPTGLAAAVPMTGPGPMPIASMSAAPMPAPMAPAPAPASPFAAPSARGDLGSPLDFSTASTPGFFERHGTGEKILGTLGDFALNYGAVTGNGFAQNVLSQRQQAEQMALNQRRQDATRMQDRGWQVEDRDAKMNAPDYFTVGNRRVRHDPRTGESTDIYTAPEQYQTYADTLGLDPSDPGYADAVKDYVLRGNGPTALAGRSALQEDRQQQQFALRGTPTYAQAHPRAPAPRRGMAFSGPPRSTNAVVAPILAKVAAGKPLTAGEQAALNYRQSRSSGGGTSPKPAAGGTQYQQIAIGAGGKKMGFDGRKWVPIN